MKMPALTGPVNFKFVAIVLGYSMTLFIVLAVVLHPDLRAQVRSMIAKDFRKVLSTVAGDLKGDGTTYKVVKIKTRDRLLLEFYKVDSDGNATPFQRIELDDKRDAFFNFRGEATNLAISDINGDEVQEIIAPSFDHELRAHINIFRLDPVSNLFSEVLPTDDLSRVR